MKLICLILVLLIIPLAAAEICDSSISIISPDFFVENEKFEFSLNIEESPFFVAEYWIEDSSGKIIKHKINTSNEKKKSFTPKNINSNLIAKAKIVYSGCDDPNMNNNYAEKTIELFKESEGITLFFEVPKKVHYYPQESNKMRNIAFIALFTATIMISVVLIWKR